MSLATLEHRSQPAGCCGERVYPSPPPDSQCGNHTPRYTIMWWCRRSSQASRLMVLSLAATTFFSSNNKQHTRNYCGAFFVEKAASSPPPPPPPEACAVCAPPPGSSPNHHSHRSRGTQPCHPDANTLRPPTLLETPDDSSPLIRGGGGGITMAVRGGANFNQRRRAWETAVKRGKGGFPCPTSWDPIDEEALRVKAETLLMPEVQRCGVGIAV